MRVSVNEHGTLSFGKMQVERKLSVVLHALSLKVPTGTEPPANFYAATEVGTKSPLEHNSSAKLASLTLA